PACNHYALPCGPAGKRRRPNNKRSGAPRNRPEFALLLSAQVDDDDESPHYGADSGHERRSTSKPPGRPKLDKTQLNRIGVTITEVLPWDPAPQYLLRDRDASCGADFRIRARGMVSTRL